MNQFLTQYRDFLRLPDVASMVFSAFASRLPIGMAALAMLMFLREAMGSFSQAGFAVGAYFVAMAIVAPITGRLVDRFGPRRLLWILGPLQPVCMLLLFAAAKLAAPFAAVVICAASAGIFQPPITVLTRTLWRYRFSDEATRKRAYSVDAVMIELNFTAGPAVIAALLAGSTPTIAFLFMIAVTAFSFAVFMASPMLKYWQRHTAEDRHLLGPLTDTRLILLFLTTFGLTFCFGLMEVGYPGYGTGTGSAAFGGVLLALNALGSATGGALYGGMHFKAPLERQYTWAMTLMALPLFLHVFVLDYKALFAIAAFLAGMCIAPALTAQTMLVARMAPAKYATEAFTWSSTFIVSGLGMGMAVGGALIERFGMASPFLTGGAIVLAMAAASTLLRATTASSVADTVAPGS
ncbi:MAG: MFS transporter [Betaproteobacteria bacterium]|nr:MFS transporter [Betaproteobacteria bacterium]